MAQLQRILENLAIMGGQRPDIQARRQAEIARRLEEEQLARTREQLLGMRAPVTPIDLVEAISRSARERGLEVTPQGLEALLGSAAAQDLGQRRVFTEEGDLLSRPLPFLMPGFPPTPTEMQEAVTEARRPPRETRAIREAQVGKLEREARGEALQAPPRQEILIRDREGTIRLETVTPDQPLSLLPGEQIVASTGRAPAEEAVFSRAMAVDRSARQRAATELSRQFPTANANMFLLAAMTGDFNILRGESPEAVRFFQQRTGEIARQMAVVDPAIADVINQWYPEEPTPQAERGEGRIVPMGTEERQLTAYMFSDVADPDVVEFIKQKQAEKWTPARIITRLRELGVRLE